MFLWALQAIYNMDLHNIIIRIDSDDDDGVDDRDDRDDRDDGDDGDDRDDGDDGDDNDDGSKSVMITIKPGGVHPTIRLATVDNDVEDAFGTLIK